MHAVVGVHSESCVQPAVICAKEIERERGLAVELKAQSPFRLTWLITVGEGISLGALWTAADGAMLLRQTLSCACTGRCIQAGIDTVSSAASLCILALIVRHAALVTSGFCGEIKQGLLEVSSVFQGVCSS